MNNSLYLDLMESALTGMLFADPSYAGNYDADVREIGGDWPKFACTMIGLKRLHQLRLACEDVLTREVPGCFFECGVWRGGAAIMMRAVLLAMGDHWRSVILADSFNGLPAPYHPVDAELDLHTKPELAVSREEVEANFCRYGLGDHRVNFVEGWFKDTLPMWVKTQTAGIPCISVLRLDGDMYSSTKESLEALYPMLSVGGYCIIDDYGAMHQCRRAVEEYRDAHGIKEDRRYIDWSGIYWIKEKP